MGGNALSGLCIFLLWDVMIRSGRYGHEILGMYHKWDIWDVYLPKMEYKGREGDRSFVCSEVCSFVVRCSLFTVRRSLSVVVHCRRRSVGRSLSSLS